ncbi:MAG: hypothetical protein ACR2FG_14350 [Marmoricola sp.]
MKRSVGAGFLTCLLLAATACGGGGSKSSSTSDQKSAQASPSSSSSTRPSVDDLSKSLVKGASGSTSNYTKSQADCIAGVLVKSGVSDQALQAIAKRDATFKESKKDDAALSAAVGDLRKCVPATSSGTSPSPGG